MANDVSGINASVDALEATEATLVAQNEALKTAIAEILTELQALRVGQVDIQPALDAAKARIDAITQAQAGVVADTAKDVADLTAAEQPAPAPATPPVPTP